MELPVQLMSDSKDAIQIVANLLFHERTKRKDIDCHFIREMIIHCTIKIEHVSTKEQPADLLTKSLGKAQHDYLLINLEVKNLFQPLA